jgi:hypothetical protein
MADQLVIAGQLVIADQTGHRWPNGSKLANAFIFPSQQQRLNWFLFLKCILYSQIKKFGFASICLIFIFRC